MSARILVVDDDRQIARLVASYLERAGFETVSAYDGESAITVARATVPELVVLDVMMPGRDGLSVMEALRAEPRLAAVPVILLTARVATDDRLQGFAAGADDYVTKPFQPAEVVARVRAVLRRTQGERRERRVLRHGDVELDADLHEVRVRGAPAALTPTEFAILETLMAMPRRVFTRTELIEAAGDQTHAGLDRTVDSHVKNLRRKIERDPARPALIETVYGVGYRFGGPEKP